MDEIIVLLAALCGVWLAFRVVKWLWLAFLFALCVVFTVADAAIPQRKLTYAEVMRRHRGKAVHR